MSLITITMWYALVAYLCVYIIYQYILIISAWQGRLKDLRKKNLSTSVQRHITVIIYTQNNLDNILNLVKVLQNQDYPKDKYKIHVILDNSTDNREHILGLIRGIKIWKLSTPGYCLGMYPAISWFLSEHKANEYTNGYVILSATNIVKSNFLSRVNIALETSSISQACLATKSPYSSLYNTIGYINNRIENRINNAGQYHQGLSSQILQSGLIISQEFLEQYPLELSILESEIDYNFKLIAQKVKVHWEPEVIIYKRAAEDINDLSLNKAQNLVKKLETLTHNFKSIIKNLSCVHFILYSFTPSRFIQVFLVLFLVLTGSYLKINIYNVSIWLIVPMIVLAGALIADLLGMLVARHKLQDYKVWLISSFMYLNEVFYTLVYTIRLLWLNSDVRKVFKKSKSQTTLKLNQPSIVREVDVVVSDGKKSFNCKLEIMAEEDNNQVTLMFKEKKFTTNRYKNLDQAFDELNKKLDSRNFRMLNCYGCGFFNYSNNSYTSSFGSEGHCFYAKQGQNILHDDVISVWDVCNNFTSIEHRNEIIENWKNSLPTPETTGLSD